MAIERNPFDRIPETPSAKQESELSQTMDGMEQETSIEIDPETGEVVVEFSTEPQEDEDSLDESQQEESDEEFYRNLAEELEDGELSDIANKVIDGFTADKESRTDWESIFERGFDLLGLKLEETAEPFQGACTAVHPVLIESAVKFQSKAGPNCILPTLLVLR